MSSPAEDPFAWLGSEEVLADARSHYEALDVDQRDGFRRGLEVVGRLPPSLRREFCRALLTEHQETI